MPSKAESGSILVIAGGSIPGLYNSSAQDNINPITAIRLMKNMNDFFVIVTDFFIIYMLFMNGVI